jgi:tellurite resistance protein TehA-like permease
VIAVSRWALVPHYIETINPNWMIPVVGNFVAALVAPIVDEGYDEVRQRKRMGSRNVLSYPPNLQVAWLWYGFAIIYWVPLFAMSIFRVTTREAVGKPLLPPNTHSQKLLTRFPTRTLTDDRLTSSLFIWLAAVAMACSSYVAIKAADCNCNPWVLDYYPRFVCPPRVTLQRKAL